MEIRDILLGVLVGVAVAAQGVILLRHAGRVWLVVNGLVVLAAGAILLLVTEESPEAVYAVLVTYALAVPLGIWAYDPQPDGLVTAGTR